MADWNHMHDIKQLEEALHHPRFIGYTENGTYLVADNPKVALNAYSSVQQVCREKIIAAIGDVIFHNGKYLIWTGSFWVVYEFDNMFITKVRQGGKPMEYNKIKFGHLTIKKVIFNDPATIVFWEDNSKTVVTCSENESFDPEKGLAMAVAKKAFGNQGNYYNQIKKWLPETEKEESTCDITWSIREAINNVFGDPKRAKAAKKLSEIQELISDMSFRGATKAELTRAIRFSKDLIDASKGADVDIAASVAELGIAELEEKYQPK